MTTQKNTLIKLETKSQLAKLIATENITIQHNQVKTASFDTLNRVLTLPIFKVQSGDVYDMLIAHECSHALFTPAEGWKQISDDDSLRQYVNVLEDTRIDLLIQKKYPGVVKNYLNGFDIMEKQNFFGLNGKDINTDLMIIDKINIRSKSMNRLPFNFSKEEQQWLQLVDGLKTFDDVVKLAKDMLAWQKKRIESLKKLPDFDDHPFNEVYGDHDTTDIESDDAQNSDNADDDGNNINEKDDQEQKEDDEESNAYNEFGAGGEGGVDPEKLIVVTNESYEKAKDELLNTSVRYNYFNLPKSNLKNVIVSSKQWNNIWNKEIFNSKTADGNLVSNTSKSRLEYINWLDNKFKAFKNDNKKTVMYLVKEFEMKKSATAYKRATTDKTGTIDPLKLKDYKFSDDIFKRLTITPDAKNHGMMMLLDWSGSMCDNIQKTIEQLMNLVWFCDKINIPYEVYLFTSEMDGKEGKYTYLDSGDKIINGKIKTWNYKNGDGFFSNFNLVNVASHKMKKRELDKSLTHLFHMGLYYNERYTYRSDREMYKGDRYCIPDQFWLGTTPLNEALVVMNELIPMFKRKYNIEKMTFITLTDGASNSNYGQPLLHNNGNGLTVKDGSTTGTPVITINKKQYKAPEHAIRGVMTEMLLKVLQEQHNVNTIGFYVVNNLRRMYELESMIGEYKDWNDKQSKIAKVKSQFNKEKCADVISGGYNKYFLLNGKDMKVENTDLSGVNESMTSGKIKQLFSKSMKGRIVSRSLLNKFIKEVA
tara:strand:- start:1380 stop:3662 length:2283 start_codon:yes stop_codon:yes gene_type:complete